MTKRTPAGFVGLFVLAVATTACSSPAATGCSGSMACPARSALVTLSHADTGTSIGVHAPNYQVRVSTTAKSSWIQATSDNGQVSFQGVVPPNHVRTFRAVAGKVSVQLGAVGVNLNILIPGVRSNWGFTTATSPYTVSFTSLK